MGANETKTSPALFVEKQLSSDLSHIAFASVKNIGVPDFRQKIDSEFTLPRLGDV